MPWSFDALLLSRQVHNKCSLVDEVIRQMTLKRGAGKVHLYSNSGDSRGCLAGTFNFNIHEFMERFQNCETDTVEKLTFGNDQVIWRFGFVFTTRLLRCGLRLGVPIVVQNLGLQASSTDLACVANLQFYILHNNHSKRSTRWATCSEVMCLMYRGRKSASKKDPPCCRGVPWR